jgi:hypothetical protein
MDMSHQVTLTGEKAKIFAELVQTASGAAVEPGDTVSVQVQETGETVQVTIAE